MPTTPAPRPSPSPTPTGTGTGASATAITDGGAITGVTITTPGAGYLTKGMRKFVDDLPGMCTPPACPNTGKYIPTAVPAQKKYNGIAADEYVIGLVQYRTSFSSDLPDTLVRGYVQIETPDNAAISQHFKLENANLDPTKPATPVLINGVQAYGVTPPQYLGPIIQATKNKPVRTTFRNLLPTGSGGDLFLPVDSSMMGSGATPTSPDGPDGREVDRRRRPQPGVHRRRPGRTPASPRTGPSCTSTAASPRGSATGRRTSGSPRPTRTPRTRRASASRTCRT